MSHLDLAVVVPVYNEEGAIRQMIESWTAALDALSIDYEMHAFDDGSKDSTAERLQELCAEFPRLRVQSKPNSGHGPTIVLGYQQLHERADWIFQVDSDNEMGPEWFYKLWNLRKDHDFIVGRRFKRNSPAARNLVSFVARIVVGTLYGGSIFDVNVPYRLMNARKFSPCYRTMPADTFAPNLLVSGFAAYHELRTAEIHIVHQFRTTGEVSIKSWKLARESMRSVLQTIAYRFGEMP